MRQWKTFNPARLLPVQHAETMRGSMAAADLLANYTPASGQTWDEEERHILSRECLCCGRVGHHQQKLEAFLAENGLDQGVYLGEGKVKDGHHRVIAAHRLGIERIPLESRSDAKARYVRDHGHVSWDDRVCGDRPAHFEGSVPENENKEEVE